MSFYGSVYYQTLGAIAKIIVQNRGASVSDFLDKSKLLQSVEIDSSGKKSALSFDSGNKWIQLNGDAGLNKISIWHGEPDESTDTFISLFNKVEEPTSEMLANSTLLDLSQGVCLATPKIYYDEAGHVYNGGDMEYFRIPIVLGGGGGVIIEGTDEDAIRALEETGFIKSAAKDQDTLFTASDGSVLVL